MKRYSVLIRKRKRSFGADQSIEASGLTAEEAAHHLRAKSRTLLLWVRQDKVKGYKLSGTKRHVWRFNVDRGKLDRPAA
jgi:hypothetical protein